jgi:hypothetical protein
MRVRSDAVAGVVAPLIRLLRPLVTWFLSRNSPYLEKNRRVWSS